MGFKDWFGGTRRARVEPDSVWLSATARLAGLREKTRAASPDGRVVVLAHFPQMLDAVEETLAAGLRCERADSEGDVAAWLSRPEPGVVGLALVGQLPSRAPQLVGAVHGRVSFLVAERHPLRSQDDRVERLAAALPYPTSVQFVLSLDDPLLERFVGERVRDLLGRLGMSDDQELSHPAVAGAVERAQKRIAEQSAAEIRADSSKDWLDTAGPIEPR